MATFRKSALLFVTIDSNPRSGFSELKPPQALLNIFSLSIDFVIGTDGM